MEKKDYVVEAVIGLIGTMVVALALYFAMRYIDVKYFDMKLDDSQAEVYQELQAMSNTLFFFCHKQNGYNSLKTRLFSCCLSMEDPF